jgi:hypothetical protein
MESSKEGGLDSWKPNEEIPVPVRRDTLTGSEIAGYLHRGQGGRQQALSQGSSYPTSAIRIEPHGSSSLSHAPLYT